MKNPEPKPTFSIDELATLVDLPIRTIRYYIQLGLVDRPEGETRAARYSSRHVEQLLQVRKWSEAGVSLERISELLSGGTAPVPPRPRPAGTVEVWSHLVIGDGIELLLEPTRAGLSPEAARKLFRDVQTMYQDLRKKD